MTEDKTKELFSLIETAISETREVRKILGEHSEILKEHTKLHKNHTEKLDLLINRTNDIANTVMTNDKRLTTIEKEVTEIRGGIH